MRSVAPRARLRGRRLAAVPTAATTSARSTGPPRRGSPSARGQRRVRRPRALRRRGAARRRRRRPAAGDGALPAAAALARQGRGDACRDGHRASRARRRRGGFVGYARPRRRRAVLAAAPRRAPARATCARSASTTAGWARRPTAVERSLQHLVRAPAQRDRRAASSSSSPTSSSRRARETWLTAVEHLWDVIPVVIQDPVWEQSFPT